MSLKLKIDYRQKLKEANEKIDRQTAFIRKLLRMRKERNAKIVGLEDLVTRLRVSLRLTNSSISKAKNKREVEHYPEA